MIVVCSVVLLVVDVSLRLVMWLCSDDCSVGSSGLFVVGLLISNRVFVVLVVFFSGVGFYFNMNRWLVSFVVLLLDLSIVILILLMISSGWLFVLVRIILLISWLLVVVRELIV